MKSTRKIKKILRWAVFSLFLKKVADLLSINSVFLILVDEFNLEYRNSLLVAIKCNLRLK